MCNTSSGLLLCSGIDVLADFNYYAVQIEEPPFNAPRSTFQCSTEKLRALRGVSTAFMLSRYALSMMPDVGHKR